MRSYNVPSLRRLKCLALCVWLAMASSIGVAFWLWRSSNLRPHAAWSAVCLAAVLGTAACLTVCALRVATRGRAPGKALGWWLVGTAPLVWFISFAANVYIDAMYRQPLTLDAPLRMTGIWAASFFDLEARFRYPRWTYGKQTLLLDKGELPSPEVLVAQMDEHIVSMANLLGQPPPSAPVTWVRGSIFGMTGRANGSWAICGPNGSNDKLDGLDRHEAAHATIAMLAGPDQDFPAVLSEGWAVSQSSDRDTLIRQLTRERESGDSYHLGELIAPNWYMRCNGPVYSHGGPLVHYLIERFGAPKFFELYCQVRRPTFADDCRRVLGVSWDEIDADFWRWIAAENERIGAGEPEIEPKSDVPAKEWKLEFAPGVAADDWQQLVDGVRQAARSRDTLPKRIGFAMQLEWTRINEERATASIESDSVLTALFDGEDFWICAAEDRDSFLMSTLNRSISLTRTSSGDVEGWVGDAWSRRRAFNEATRLVETYRGANVRPEDWLPIDERDVSQAAYRLERIERPGEGEPGVWRVTLLIEYDDDNSQYCELDIDPALDWQLTRGCTVGSPKGYTEFSAEYRQIDGIWFATSNKFEAVYLATKERVSSQSTFRTLTADEERDLKQRVERIALAGPTKPWRRLRAVLSVLVIAWPVIGVVCLTLPMKRCP